MSYSFRNATKIFFILLLGLGGDLRKQHRDEPVLQQEEVQPSVQGEEGGSLSARLHCQPLRAGPRQRKNILLTDQISDLKYISIVSNSLAGNRLEVC